VHIYCVWWTKYILTRTYRSCWQSISKCTWNTSHLCGNNTFSLFCCLVCTWEAHKFSTQVLNSDQWIRWSVSRWWINVLHWTSSKCSVINAHANLTDDLFHLCCVVSCCFLLCCVVLCCAAERACRFISTVVEQFLFIFEFPRITSL